MAKGSAIRYQARRTVHLLGKRYAPGRFVPLKKADPEEREQLIEDGRVVQVDQHGFAVGEE